VLLYTALKYRLNAFFTILTKRKMEKKKTKNRKPTFFELLSSKVTKLSGSSGAFILAIMAILIWLATGPIFHYSDTWQLVINTGTTIITFLMVFLIQRSQNKESLAVQVKLNELIASSELASNRLINVEDLTEDEIVTLRKYFSELSKMAEKEETMHKSHSIEEAEEMHRIKTKHRHKTLGE
jgi:low affinity Fe/Cu permease